MKDENEFGSPFLRQLLAVSGVVLYMIGTGANIAYPGVLLQQLREPGSAFKLSPQHESWIASILGLALITGILIAPFSLQRLGRRLTNQLSCLPSLGGWALLIASKGPITLLISRFLIGFGMGVQAACAPVSIAEYSAPNLRGVFLATIAFSFATGMLAAHVFGTILYWRAAGVACGSFYLISLILISLSPETPPFLASKERFNQCRKSFRWLRGKDPNSERELEILLTSQKIQPQKISKLKYMIKSVKKPEFYKPTLIMMFLFVLFQVSGMTVVPSYTVPMMMEIHKGSMEANSSMILIDILRFLTSIIACVVVNKFNRRTVLFVGLTITVLSLFLISLLLYIRDSGLIPREYNWIPMIPTLTYIFGKTIGILPIPWAVAGEIFPLEYRSIGSGISGMILSIMFFVIVKTAPSCFETFGMDGTLLMYGMSCTICGIFLYFLLPETKGKTLYEIECYFRGESEKENECEIKILELQNMEGG